MKKLIILSLITFLFSTNAYEQTAPARSAQITSKSGLALREKPDTNSRRIHVIPSGETVTVLEEGLKSIKISDIESKWYKVRYDNKTGWVFGGYLSFNSDNVLSSAGDLNIFCYRNTKGNLIISDISGKKQTLPVKSMPGYNGKISDGDSTPKLSADKRYLTYLDNKGMVRLYDISKKTDLNLKDSIKGFDKFPATEMLITGWTKNFLIFHISQYVNEEDSSEEVPWDDAGFYIYSLKDHTTVKLSGVNYIVSLIPASDDLIVLADINSENILSIYNILSGETKSFLTLPGRYTQFSAADRNNLTYIYHDKISDSYNANVIFHSLADNSIKKIATGDWAEYQFPELFYSNQFIIYSHLYRKNEDGGFVYDEFFALYDLKNRKNKELFKCDKRITTGNYVVFRDGKSLFCYNILTEAKTLIAADVVELY